LSEQQVGLINDYLAIRGEPGKALGELRSLADKTGKTFADAVDLFHARLGQMQDAGIETAATEFAAVFGRSLEYYTGFVFQIDRERADGALENIAGGGRYDTMLADIGAGQQIPAVGLAIQASRLLEVPVMSGTAKLTLALPSKGRLREAAEAMFARAGFEIVKTGSARGYQGEVRGRERARRGIPVGFRDCQVVEGWHRRPGRDRRRPAARNHQPR
jgi:histidyl-tRNA synthetase